MKTIVTLAAALGAVAAMTTSALAAEPMQPSPTCDRACLYRVLDDPRLPPLLRQAPAPWAPDGAERVDAAFPSMKWIVESDGRAWHTRVADFERDRRRDHLAQMAGWSVTRFTMEQIDRSGYVIDTLLAAFAERSRVA